MKFLKLCVLAIFCAVLLAACGGDFDPSGAAPALENPTRLADFAVSSANSTGVVFYLRNTSEARLYYSQDFGIYRAAGQIWSPEALPLYVPDWAASQQASAGYIEPGAVLRYFLQWGTEFSTGHYKLVREIFTDPNDLRETLEIPFEIVGRYLFRDGAQLPAGVEQRWQERHAAQIAFYIAGGTSEIIVAASEVEVSRSAVAFYLQNLSDDYYWHGRGWQLARYKDGEWLPMPLIMRGDIAFAPIAIPIAPHSISRSGFNFARTHGVLENGRYMIIREHFSDDFTPGGPRSIEFFLVEFEIDENTREN